MPVPANRLTTLPPYVFVILGQRVQELVARGIDVINLDVGSPDMPPPSAVIDVLTQSAHRPNGHGYTGYLGTPTFREAVAGYYLRRFGVEVDPHREVLPLIGSKEGIVNLALAYLDRGDNAFVPQIGYPAYAMGARLASAEVRWLPLSAESGYLPDLRAASAEVDRRTKLLWVNYPNNPTGATAELEFYQQAVDFCREHDVLLASDNPYVDVTFDNYRAPSVLQVPGAKACAVEFVSLSKTYNMAGWRLGAAVGGSEAIRTLLQVKSNVDSGHFQAVYDAGAAALNNTPPQWIQERNRVYQRRRDRIVTALPELGLEAAPPRGSLYIWGKVKDGDGQTYVEEALNHAHVALAPGEAYGPGGKQFVRMSLAVSDDQLDLAIQRMKAWRARR